MRNPWAWAIMFGGKTIENRDTLAHWRHAAGRRIAVHASRTIDYAAIGDVLAMSGVRRLPHLPDSAGLILGTVDVMDVHQAGRECGPGCEPWGQPGGVHLVLDNPRATRDVLPVRGQLGLWRLADDVAAALDGRVLR